MELMGHPWVFRPVLLGLAMAASGFPAPGALGVLNRAALVLIAAGAIWLLVNRDGLVGQTGRPTVATATGTTSPAPEWRLRPVVGLTVPVLWGIHLSMANRPEARNGHNDAVCRDNPTVIVGCNGTPLCHAKHDLLCSIR